MCYKIGDNISLLKKKDKVFTIVNKKKLKSGGTYYHLVDEHGTPIFNKSGNPEYFVKEEFEKRIYKD
jgi:hypothetical protein